jgi:oxepin-CoA hydrolase/3-oxo-5,6-dehydrosuberyl-CoA semialdehyde dehydrogenase
MPPSEEGIPLEDAATGEIVAEVSSAGVDMAAVVAHARSIGGPALRALTFHQRAGILRAVGKLLLEPGVKADLYALSHRTGATGKDSWIDIDGGAGVLLSYASKGRRELPNSHVAIDGPPEVLAADGSFLGAHIHTPRRGVAVQINAFNFPVWGLLEKFAPAFLAGVPTVAKPASQTSYLAEAMVRVVVESGLLPDGSLQLISGSTRDLLDHLDGQDSVGFTGSASTARLLRAHPNIVEKSVHFTAEADSLNSAVLTPSAAPRSPEFDLFVREVVTEMTTKAGQKCTAIRRAFVPTEHLDAATEALEQALARVVVGDPADTSTTMGALASRGQRDEVQAAIERLRGAADAVVDTCRFVGVDPARGAFMAPTLLRATDRFASEIHTTEAFGPVSTLVPYDSTTEVIDLVARGEGSLVASVYGADPGEVTEVVTGIAAHHGRVHVVDSTVAETSTGHGSPLPHLVHGGPGRAGGGEELGGMRGVFHHMQRTAVQGSPDMVSAITGEYMPGASTSETKGHPFRLTFDDLEIGDSITTPSRVISRQDIADFAESTGDRFYAHMDDEAAARSPIFDGLVAHGYLVVSFAAGLFVWPDEGPVLANYGIDKLRFATPTYPGDEIHVVLTCKRKTQLDGRGYGEVAWDTLVVNQNGEVAAAYDVLTMVANRPGVNGAPE